MCGGQAKGMSCVSGAASRGGAAVVSFVVRAVVQGRRRVDVNVMTTTFNQARCFSNNI